ncbi:MAG: hypothetical protein LBF15_06310 [Candidatus Peribacteria bacterium]|jgi:hypothetical protein|nr:hypothetical protein [Candidatus Peribacteria bacterium]
MNGNPDTPLSNSYEPFVFYFDQFREESGLNYPSYLAYNSYLDNKEDIVYNRFTTELANKLKGEVLQYSQDEVMSMMTAFDPTFNANIVDNSVSDIVPDIQARHIIENATNKFLEIFSKGSMSSIRENVYNA